MLKVGEALLSMITLHSTEYYDIITIPSQNISLDATITPKFIIAHCIGLPLLDVIEGLTCPIKENTKGLGVSAHYFIPQISALDFMSETTCTDLSPKFPNNPPVICFAQEDQLAYHAGISSWKEHNGLNTCSIGIEFHAPGYGNGGKDWFAYTPYTASQMETGALLMKDIVDRWNMDPKNILAHSDICPYISSTQRSPIRIKTDPGALFPWSYLYERGIGFYPTPSTLEISYDKMRQQEREVFVREHLHSIGYAIPIGLSLPWGDLEKYTVNAYKMHYMQGEYKICRPGSNEFGKIDEELMMSLKRCR